MEIAKCKMEIGLEVRDPSVPHPNRSSHCFFQSAGAPAHSRTLREGRKHQRLWSVECRLVGTTSLRLMNWSAGTPK